jgi:hypothetical protein
MVLGILLANKLYLYDITTGYRFVLSVLLGVIVYLFSIYVWPGKFKSEINDILRNLANKKNKSKFARV